jgi:hypothetical protein
MSGTEGVHVSALASVFSADTELSEDGHYTATMGSVCHMVYQVFKGSKYPASFQTSVQR